MLLDSYEEVEVYVLDKEDISPELKLRLEGKKEIHGEDYEDDEFYTTEKRPMLIDLSNQFLFIQEDEETIILRRLVDKQVLSIQEDGQMMTFSDEFRFKGTIKNIKEQWERKIS